MRTGRRSTSFATLLFVFGFAFTLYGFIRGSYSARVPGPIICAIAIFILCCDCNRNSCKCAHNNSNNNNNNNNNNDTNEGIPNLAVICGPSTDNVLQTSQYLRGGIRYYLPMKIVFHQLILLKILQITEVGVSIQQYKMLFLFLLAGVSVIPMNNNILSDYLNVIFRFLPFSRCFCF